MIFAGKPSKDDEKILTEALARYKRCLEAENKYRPLCLADQRFVDHLDQWPEPIKKLRKNKPMLVIDHIGTAIHQIVNDMRQNKLAIKVRPMGNGADVQKAKQRQALIRYFENCSRAPSVYDYCGELQVKVGEGFARVRTKVVDKETNEQDIVIERILNWCSVHLDPDRQEQDGSDAMYGFIVDEVDKDSPEVKDIDVTDWNSDAIGDTQREWLQGDKVRLAEYYRIEGEGESRKCKWYKLCGTKILETKDIPGPYVPIAEFVGEESFVEGERHRRGIVRRAKDAQVMYNVQSTAEAERTAQMPKGKWIGTKRQFEGLDQSWAGANTDDKAYLPFNTDPQYPTAPRFETPEGVPSSLVNAKMAAREDIKFTTGVFDDGLGRQSNAQSGKAVLARQREGDTANYHYTDNQSKAVSFIGRIIESWLPEVVDTPRVFQITGDDGKEMALAVNMTREEALAKGHESAEVLEDLKSGEYEVFVEAGPSYATKRQEDSATIEALLDKMPILQEAAPDLILESFDFDKAQDIADRIRQKMGIQSQDGTPTPPPDPAMMQQMQQMQMENAALKDQLGAATQAAHDKQSTEQLKADTEIQKARIDAWAKIEVAKITVMGKAQAAQADAEAAQAAQQVAPDDQSQGDAIHPAMAEMLHGLMEGLNELRAQVAQLAGNAPAPVADEPAPAPNAGMGPAPQSVGTHQ